MSPDDIKDLIGTVIVLAFVAYAIKRSYDLRQEEKEKRKNTYNPDEYDR